MSRKSNNPMTEDNSTPEAWEDLNDSQREALLELADEQSSGETVSRREFGKMGVLAALGLGSAAGAGSQHAIEEIIDVGRAQTNGGGALGNLGEISGPITSGTTINNLVGSGLAVSNGELEASGSSSADRVDVFAIGGQSNAEGRGDATQSPNLSADISQVYESGGLVPTEDPVGGAMDGSAWPAFAQRYYELTGNKTVFVERAVGGSSQTAAADGGPGNWSSTGSLRSDLVTGVDDVMSHLSTSGYDARFRGILWNQGEADEEALNAGTITQSDYQTALEDMISYYDSQLSYGPWLFGVFELGYGYSDNDSTEAIRQAQRDVVRDTHNAAFLSGLARNFGSLHYSQTEYNAWGRDGAERLATNDVHVPRQGVTAYLGPDQTLDNYSTVGGFTQVALDSYTTDIYRQFNTSGSEIVVQDSGKYLLSGSVELRAAGDGTALFAHIDVNGTTVAENVSSSGVDDFLSSPIPGKEVELSEGDTVTMTTAHTASSQKDIVGDERKTWLSLSPVDAGRTQTP